MNLRATSAAIGRLPANMGLLPGVHNGSELKVGATGTMIADVPLEEHMLSPLLENPLSAMGIATGKAHGTLAKTQRPLLVNVVVHINPADREMPEWLEPLKDEKVNLGLDLLSAIHRARRLMDHSGMHVLGNNSDISKLGRGVEVVEGTKDLAAAKETVQKIGNFGITLVVGDHLDDLLPDEPKSPYVAVKVNHPLEVQVPLIKDRKIIWPVKGSSRGVRLWVPKEVDAYNAELDEIHGAINKRFEDRGVPVAQVLTSDKMTPLAIDKSIANAVNELRKTKRSISGKIA